MESSFINANNRSVCVYWIFACVFLISNLLNMVLWSIGSSLSPYFYTGMISLFLVITLTTNKYDYVILAGIIFSVLLSLGSPIMDWDARSIWFFHAKRIFIDNNLYAQLDNYAPWSHNDYPILVPSLAASIAKTVGFWNDYFPRLSLIGVLLPVFLTFKYLFNNTFFFNLWVIGAIFICKLMLINGYMDGILSLYIAAGSLFLITIYDNPDTKHNHHALFFLILATLPFIKNEGFLAVLLFFICLLPKITRNFRRYGYLLLAIVPYFLLWKIPLVYHHINNDLFVSGILERALSRLENLSELSKIFNAFISISGSYLLLLGCFLLAFKKHAKNAYPAMLFIVFYVFFMIFIYIITPYNLNWHLGTSADRVFLTVNMCSFSLILYIFASSKKGCNYFKTLETAIKYAKRAA